MYIIATPASSQIAINLITSPWQMSVFESQTMVQYIEKNIVFYFGVPLGSQLLS